MEPPPHALPNGLSVLSLLTFDKLRNFSLENVSYRATVTANRIGVAHAFSTVCIAQANRNKLECLDLTVRSIALRDGEWDPVQSGLGMLDHCHARLPISQKSLIPRTKSAEWTTCLALPRGRAHGSRLTGQLQPGLYLG